ncbi:MAG: hypothetical protein WC955_06415 [Elusimicrobiota bacterium]
MPVWDKELFIELQETVQIVPPKAGLAPGLDKYFKDGVITQPVIRRKSVVANNWAHLNMARAERPIAKMDMQMVQRDCFFCKGKEDKTPGCVETKGDYVRIGTETDWKLRAFPNLYPWLIGHLNIVECAEHKVSIAQLDDSEEVVAWQAAAKIVKDLEKKKVYPMVFRNHGWGASVSHYHWQVGALPYIPNSVNEELVRAKQFYRKYKTNIFDALMQSEKSFNTRVIDENDNAMVLAAYAPRAAVELWVVSKLPVSSLAKLKKPELEQMAVILDKTLKKMFDRAGIDTMNIIVHQMPGQNKYYRLHIEIMPFKHLAGAERGFGEYAIEVVPEKAAELLK